MRRTFKLLVLAGVFLLLSPVAAYAGVVRSGTETVSVGWPGSYFLSGTEYEFRTEGCPEPSSLNGRNWDAAIIDVDPGSWLKIELHDPLGSMNMAFYDEDCDPQSGLYGTSWAGAKSVYTKLMKPNYQWAVVTFNYGYNIALDWKVCQAVC